MTRNDYEKSSYILSHLFWGILASIWHNNFLFRCLWDYSLGDSKKAMWLIVFIFSGCGILIDWKKNRNGISIAKNLVLGFGCYTILTYYDVRPALISKILAAGTVLSAALFLFMLQQVFRRNGNRKKLLNKCLYRTLQNTRVIFCGICIVVGAVFGIFRIMGSATIIGSDVKPAAKTDLENQTIQANIKALSNFEQKYWKKLSVKKKLSLLQVVANIEQNYLGIPYAFTVGTADLDGDTEGYYHDDTHEIIIDLKILQEADAEDVLNILCHEAFHGMEYRMVDAYYSVDEDLQGLIVFDKAADYAENLDNYEDGSDDFDAYYDQAMEEDARSYARGEVARLGMYIREYLKEGEKE